MVALCINRAIVALYELIELYSKSIVLNCIKINKDKLKSFSKLNADKTLKTSVLKNTSYLNH